jgi:hypothetical protein
VKAGAREARGAEWREAHAPLPPESAELRARTHPAVSPIGSHRVHLRLPGYIKIIYL